MTTLLVHLTVVIRRRSLRASGAILFLFLLHSLYLLSLSLCVWLWTSDSPLDLRVAAVLRLGS
jgi:hypothetical protein